ncbi:DUF552 domain-containing protein [Candidatus Woesearchaeota archaeon]|nr:DUF552 domain-containing protein [Candidatus Woesearchaeota archaeon]
MSGFFSKLKEKVMGEDISSEIMGEAEHDGYVELGTESNADSSKIVVRPFILEDFESIKPILDSLREGHTVALINIKPLKDKDLVELKRAINKLKKTSDAIEGDIAGFGDDWIAAVPAFAHIHRGKAEAKKKEEVNEVTEFSRE